MFLSCLHIHEWYKIQRSVHAKKNFISCFVVNKLIIIIIILYSFFLCSVECLWMSSFHGYNLFHVSIPFLMQPLDRS